MLETFLEPIEPYKDHKSVDEDWIGYVGNEVEDDLMKKEVSTPIGNEIKVTSLLISFEMFEINPTADVSHPDASLAGRRRRLTCSAHPGSSPRWQRIGHRYKAPPQQGRSRWSR